MALSQTQQIYEAIKKSNSTLITFDPDHNGDTVASSLALSLLLKKLDKHHEVVSHGFDLPDHYSFLPLSEDIKHQPEQLRKFIITLDVSKTKIKNLNYHQEDDKLHIHIDPEEGNFSHEDLTSSKNNFKHDLIIVLNTPDLESLGGLHEEHPDFFYHTPILNIDHSTENENFGHYNLVNVTSTSVAELIYELIEEIDSNLLDEDMATCLLAGMIVKTNSFKTTQVTPKSLHIASQLIAAGADRDNIIKNIYQTKSVSTLKLWGKVLLGLELSEDQKLAWADIKMEDFTETKTTSKDLPQVVNEMITNIPTIDMTALFYQSINGQFALIKTEKNLNLLELLQDYNPQGNKGMVKLELKESTPQDLIFHLKSLVK